MSESVADAYRKCDGIDASQNIWRLYFAELVDCTQRLQHLVEDSAAGLQSHDVYLHNRYYAMRIISLRIANMYLAFWQNICENTTGIATPTWYMEFIPNIFSTIISQTTFVDDPAFSAKRKGLRDCDFLWTPSNDDEALMLRWYSRRTCYFDSSSCFTRFYICFIGKRHVSSADNFARAVTCIQCTSRRRWWTGPCSCLSPNSTTGALIYLTES
jgi:hypothetical protein